jgi:hypothetical protein
MSLNKKTIYSTRERREMSLNKKDDLFDAGAARNVFESQDHLVSEQGGLLILLLILKNHAAFPFFVYHGVTHELKFFHCHR